MSANLFTAKEHVIPASHIRGYERGVRDEYTADLRLSVKEYIPTSTILPGKGAITIIIFHASGFPKECYEPLLELLLQSDLRIRGIWSIDNVHQGASYLLNKGTIGDEPHWFGHSRDVLHAINYFRMPPPIVGVGHSIGTNQMMHLSILHPRLLSGLIAIEPAFRGASDPALDKSSNGAILSIMATKRRDMWDSREDAQKSFMKAFKSFDTRVMERYVQYGLREVARQPSLANASTTKTLFTLTTPKAMEPYTYMKPDPPLPGYPTDLDINTPGKDAITSPGFYRAESSILFQQLPHLRPPVLYIFGAQSAMSTVDRRRAKLEATGSGSGGSGGVEAGKVSGVVIPSSGHFVCFEKVGQTAGVIEDWLRKRTIDWELEMTRKERQPRFQSTINSEWVSRLPKL